MEGWRRGIRFNENESSAESFFSSSTRERANEKRSRKKPALP